MEEQGNQHHKVLQKVETGGMNKGTNISKRILVWTWCHV